MSVVITPDPDYWGISWSGGGDVKRGLTSADLKFEAGMQIKPGAAGCRETSSSLGSDELPVYCCVCLQLPVSDHARPSVSPFLPLAVQVCSLKPPFII